MKTLILTIITLFVVFECSSCAELMPCDGRFYVNDVQPHDKGIYSYQLVSITGKNTIWVKDSANKYIVGDTVKIVLLNH